VRKRKQMKERLKRENYSQNKPDKVYGVRLYQPKITVFLRIQTNLQFLLGNVKTRFLKNLASFIRVLKI